MSNMMRAMTYGLGGGGNRFVLAWLMFAATREYSIAHGLTFRDWFPCAAWNFWHYLKRGTGEQEG